LELKTGAIVEIQVKKGLVRGNELWTPLLNLSKAVDEGTIHFGILAVAPDSSGIIRNDLARDIRRLADGREDGLSDIGKEFLGRLRSVKLPVSQTCGRIRIRVVHGLEVDSVEIKAAKEVLRYVCAREADVDAAWNALYRGAVAIMERRGRWRLPQLLQLLAAERIDIRDAEFPAALAAKLSTWVVKTNSWFHITGLRKCLPLEALLPFRTVTISFQRNEAETAAAALERYHSFGRRRSSVDDNVYDAEWTGRFYHNTVVVAGPGLGKSTLITKLAHTYASDGYPVLRVSLKSVAGSMRNGVTFEDSIWQWGLDGSGINPNALRQANLRELVVLADGLDDCGDQHHQVAAGLARFAQGHSLARIVVTTRPVGYDTYELAAWRHYALLPPDKDSGKVNLGSLIQAATDSPKASVDPHITAARELARTAAADAITASPQMLGMAASIIVQRGSLSESRAQLYDEMISLFQTSPRAPSSGKAPGLVVSARVLDILGWTLVQDPLAQARQVTLGCAKLIAPKLGVRPLAAVSHVETAIHFWEKVGLVERLHHSGTTLMTFVHKTFAEFTAARFLNALPSPERRRQLERMIDDPTWREVISFAGGLGAGDEIVELLVARRANGQPELFVHALALIGDPDAAISEPCAHELVEGAFTVIEKGDTDCFDLGLAIADLASKRPDLVGPIAAARISSQDSSVKLVAWTCAVAAGTAYHDPKQIMSVVRDLLPQISKGFMPSLLGGIRLGVGKDRDLIQRLALAALENIPKEQLEAFVETELGHPAFGNVGFQAKLEALLRGRGVRSDWKPSWKRTSVEALLTADREWGVAFRAALRAVAEAVTAERDSKPSCSTKDRLLQFSALIRLVGFNEAVASDVHAWTNAYDRAAVRETLRVLVEISAIDAAELAMEAASLIRRLDTSPDLTIFALDLPVVDVPEPVWGNVLSANPDQALLQKALEHHSTWLVELATRLLQAIPTDEAELTSLLGISRGFGLAAAAHLITVQYHDRAADILLERLEGNWGPGVHYLFRILQTVQPPMTDRLMNVLNRALTGKSVLIAEAAAALASDLVARGAMTDPRPIEQAFAYWQVHEEPTPAHGTIPSSPRKTLLKALLALNAVSDDRLFELLRDPRSDVRSLAEKQLLERLPLSPTLRESFVTAVLARTVPAGFAARVFSNGLELNAEQVIALSKLLDDAESKWRLAGMHLLRSPYLSEDQIKAQATRLTSDVEEEIRLHAQHVLKNLR